jgi:hypothetical protein
VYGARRCGGWLEIASSDALLVEPLEQIVSGKLAAL